MISFYSNYKKNYIHIIAYIADICNYNCDFCYNIKPRTKKFLNLDKLFVFLKKIYIETNKKIFLEILGGEPTLHPNLIDFIEKLNKLYFIEYFVFTNFSQDIDFYKKLLNNRCALSITWHSRHNDICNVNFISKVKELNLQYFKNPGIRLRILYEIDHISEALNTFDYFFNIYKDFLEFDILANIKDKKFNYSIEQLNQFNLRINKLKKPNEQHDYIKNDNEKIILFKFNDIVKHPIFNFKNWICNAGKDCLYIHCNGDIYPCESYYFADSANVFKYILGNIYDNTFKMKTHGLICRCT